MANGTKLLENIHEGIPCGLHLCFALTIGFDFKFLVSLRLAPFFLGLRGITVDFCGIKRRKVHRYHSCFLYFTGMVNEIRQMLPLEFQQPDLLGGAVACGVNTRPDGLKTGWLWLFRVMYLFNRSPLFKLMLTEPDITPEQLAAIRCPVLVTGGSKDMISQQHLGEAAGHIPGAALRILPGESHGSYIIGSEKIAEIVLEFAKGNQLL